MGGSFTIVGLGEALFDVFVADNRSVLGGAPLNVAVHAHQAASALGGEGVVVTRVGTDELGDQLLHELDRRGMATAFVQRDDAHPTGRVFVTVQEGEPHYEIVEGVAWDQLVLNNATRELAAACQAVCFGSLAQRDPVARDAILGFVSAASQAVRMFDVNLRQAYYDEAVLRRSCELATAVKLNEHELSRVADALGLPADPGALRNAFDLVMVAFTRGPRGTVLFTADGRVEGEPVRYEPQPQADSVGAGDACSAGLLLGMVRGWSWQRTLDVANHLGAFVASQAGATPGLPKEILAMAGD